MEAVWIPYVEVGSDMQSEGVEAVGGHEDEGIKNDDEGEKNVDRAEAEEKLRKPKQIARPYIPIKTEVYGHEATHLPYRSWCWH